MESTLIPFIPSNLLPLLQTDLLVLEQARKKNAAQHRSALFFRRVHEVYRLGKEIYRELGWTNEWLSEERERRKAEAFRIHHELKEEGHEQIQRIAEGDALEHIDRLTKLLEKVRNQSFLQSQRTVNLTISVTDLSCFDQGIGVRFARLVDGRSLADDLGVQQLRIQNDTSSPLYAPDNIAASLLCPSLGDLHDHLRSCSTSVWGSRCKHNGCRCRLRRHCSVCPSIRNGQPD